MRQCVLEIFTFLRMGGAVERIEVHLIADPRKGPIEAREELMTMFATFDAAKALRSHAGAPDQHPPSH